MCVEKIFCFAFSRPGSDLLSRVLRRSTIGAGAFHGRVRNGNGCGRPAMTTRSAKGKTFEKLVEAFASFVFLEHVVFCLHAAAILRSLRCRRRAKRLATDLRPAWAIYGPVDNGIRTLPIQRLSASPVVRRPPRSIGSKTRSCVSASKQHHLTSSDEHGQ